MIKKFKLILGVVAGALISITMLTGKTVIVQASEGIVIDEKNFPDEIFREYIKTKIDQNKDNILSNDEINFTKNIDIDSFFADDNNKIKNLHGIEYFTSLEKLNCGHNLLDTLDIGKNTKLKELACHDNNLTELDISKNLELTTLNCMDNNLNKIDVSQNTKLIKLFCGGVFRQIDISQNTVLQEFTCNSNNLLILDTSHNTSLTKLSCSSDSLGKLDINKNTKLKYLHWKGDNISKLDLSNNLELETLHFHCKSADLDVSKNIKLTLLDCTHSMLAKLDVSNNKLLKYLYYEGNDISELDLRNNPDIEDLQGITKVDGSLNNLNKLILNKRTYGKLQLLERNFYNGGYDFSDLSNVTIENGKIIVTDITKPGTYKYQKHKYNGASDNDDYKLRDMAIIYVDDDDTGAVNPPSAPSGDFIKPDCTHLFNDYNYISPVSGSPVIIYGNGGTFKTDTTKTTNKQFIAYTDILASYNYSLNAKGVVKPSAGKVIVGITKSNVKPVVTKNKIIDKDAAKIARAKIKNGQITVTATGKEKGLVYLWIIDTGNKGVYESCPINVLLAPKKLEVCDTAGNKLKNLKLENGKTLDVNVTGIVSSNTKTDDCTYTATVASNSQGYISVVPSGNSGKKFTIKATGLKNNKNTKVTVIFQCNENNKKAKFSLTITK